MSTLNDTADFDEFVDELLNERAARPLIIVAAAKIDYLLFEIMSNHFLPKLGKEKDRDDLLQNESGLGKFSIRIKFCYRAGFIDESLFKVLDCLRDLRNDCAHQIKFAHDKSPAREYLKTLKERVGTRKSYELTKARYFEEKELTPVQEIQCQLLTICVLLEAVRLKTSVTKGNKETLKLSAN